MPFFRRAAGGARATDPIVAAAARLDAVHGLDGRRRRYVARHPGPSLVPPAGARALAAWTGSADEPALRAYLPGDEDPGRALEAFRRILAPEGFRLADEEDSSPEDPRLGETDLELLRAEAAPKRRRRGAPAAPPEVLPGLPVYALRHAPRALRASDAAGTDGATDRGEADARPAAVEASLPPPARLRVEAPGAFPAFSLLVPQELPLGRGALARAVPTAVAASGSAAPGPRIAVACEVPAGKTALRYAILFPALAPEDPAGPAAAERFAAIAAAAAAASAAFLAVLKVPTGAAVAGAPTRVEALPEAAILVEAELRLGARDLPLLVAVPPSTVGILARIAGLAPPPAGADPVSSFLEANRRLRGRLAPLRLKAFAARPGLAAFLRLLGDGDRARVASRLTAAFRPVELLPAFRARPDGTGGPAAPNRAGSRDRDLLDSVPAAWAEDWDAALAALAPAELPSEAEAAAADAGFLAFLEREAAAGRLELSADARACLAPVRDKARAERARELRALAEGDGLWALVAGAGRRLGASALAGVPDRDLVLATVEEPERRADLAPLMSPGRRHAFAEDAAWADARWAAGGLDPGECAAARREAKARFSARLEALRRGEAAERARERPPRGS